MCARRLRFLWCGVIFAAGLSSEMFASAQEIESAVSKDTGSAPGEDLGRKAGDDDLWTRIQQRMRSAERNIRQQDTSLQTQQIQQQVVDDLTDLIDRLSQSHDSPPTPQPGSKTPRKQPGDRANDAAGKAGSQGGDPRKATDTGDEDPRGARQLLLNVWGQLPEQLQDQIQSPLREEFLPQFEQLIVDYYKRLAEGE